MALPRAFLSFDATHDEKFKNLFAGQCKTDSPTPFSAEDWSSKAPLPQAEWERIIKEKISRCNMLIILVGKHMGAAGGVVKEIEYAKHFNLPVFGVYVDGADSGSVLPVGISANNVVPWKWDRIATMIDKCMKAGKNA